MITGAGASGEGSGYPFATLPAKAGMAGLDVRLTATKDDMPVPGC